MTSTASTSARGATATPGTMFETFEPKTQSARYERARVWGLDCADVLRWRQWEPGGTYVRSVVLKNVSTKAIKVKYKLPATKYFEMEFPEVIKLSPGMSIPVDVTFRPIKREQYDDFVEFKVAGCGSFRVKTQAPLPVLSLALPKTCDLGYGAVNELMRGDFEFANDGDVALEYEWRLDLPFTFEPKRGHLNPGQTARVRCEFTPTDATCAVATAACVVTPEHDFHDGGATCAFVVDVRAIGKYPFIRLSEKDLDFGAVLVGKTAEKTVRLLNQSPVSVTTSCHRDEKEHDGVFRCGPCGKPPRALRRESYDSVRVQFTPSMPGTFSNETFTFTTPGGKRDAVLRVTGTAIGPTASLTATTLQFGSAVSGTEVKRIFDVQNHSDVPLFWQMDSDKTGTWRLDVDRGTVPPREKQRVLVTFAPAEPANYHRRILVLVRDAAPLALDVVGTCYDNTRRPAPMYLSHVESYRAACAASLLSPGQPPARRDRAPFEEELVAARAASATAAETFGACFEPDPLCAVELDTHEVDFGACSRLRVTDAKTVTVTNRAAAKMTVFWGGASGAGGLASKEAGTEAQAPFAVFPESADVRPGASQTFRVSFRPNRDHAHYARALECFAYVKTMRSFRQVTEETFTPPWCASVRAFGHTFGPAGSARVGFMPKCRFGVAENTLLFPPTVVGELSYQTVALINDGDVTVSFEFPDKRRGGVDLVPVETLDEDDDARSVATRSELRRSSFSCYPTKGVVHARSFSLITFRFDAADEHPRREPLVCALNGSTEHALALDARARGFFPKLRVGADDAFVFKPTCVGAVAARDVDVTNVSRINVLYEWSIPEKLSDVLSVSPAGGMIRGGETVPSHWTFCPRKIKRLGFKVALNLRVPNSYEKNDRARLPGAPPATAEGGRGADAGAREERVHVSVTAEGTSGAIALRPESLDFGHTIVDHPETRQIELVNKSGGVIRYRLETVWDDEDGGFDADVQYDEQTGLVPARAGKFVEVRFVGRARARVGFKIACHTADTPTQFEDVRGRRPSRSLLTFKGGSLNAADGLDDADADPPPCVAATGHSAYPALRVRDVACASSFLAKPALWKQLSVNALNAALAQTPSPAEIKAHRAGGLDGSFASSRSMRAVDGGVAVGLGAGALGDAPTCVYLELENASPLRAEWRLLMRNEVEVELENWVEIGEPEDEVDAHQRRVVERRIVEISPRAGALEPGQRQPVRIKYAHDEVGAHWLTALLRVKEGRSVRLELGGRTTAPMQRCLDVGPANPAASVHTLAPVPLGEAAPPAQTVELRNPTDFDVRYDLDLSAVEDLNADAWDFPVFTCVERTGVVPARGSALVNWVFQPVEEKTYECRVGVRLSPTEEDADAAAASGEALRVEHATITLRARGTLPETFGGKGSDASALGDCAGDCARNNGEWPAYDPVPTLPPACDFALSTHVAVFGETPAGSLTRRLVLLRSRADDAYTFEWDLGAFATDAIDGTLVIEPRKGTLEPHGVAFIKLSYRAEEKPQVFDGRVTCALTPVRPTRAEREEEKRLTAARRARPETFAAHTDLPQPSMPSARELAGGTDVYDAIRQGSQNTNRMSVVHAATVSSSAKWPALAEAGARAHEKTMPPEPANGGIPPDAALALGVEGRVVSPEALREAVGLAAYARHFVPSHAPDAFLQMQRSRRLASLAAADASARLATPEQKKLLAGVLHDVLADPATRREFETLKREPPEYYRPERAGEATSEKAPSKEEASRLDDTSDASAREEALPDELDESVFEGVFESVGDVPEKEKAEKARRKGSAAAWVDGDTTGFPSDVAVDPRETARACVNPEFRELAEWTVEATLFNLVRELEAARAEEAAFDGVGDDAVRWDSAGEDSFEYDGRSEEE